MLASLRVLIARLPDTRFPHWPFAQLEGIGRDAMHDIRFIRENPDAFDHALARRGADPAAAAILALDEQRRAVATKMQELQSRRNEASKAIGQAMGQGDSETAEALKAEVGDIKQTLPTLEDEERALGAKLQDMLARLPNRPADDVPDGADEADNVEVAQWGELPSFDFKPQEHADFAPSSGYGFRDRHEDFRCAVYIPAR